MTIWLLGLIIVASVAAVGLRQGGIRAGFSFFGIVVGGFLASPVGHLLARLLGSFGLKDPVWLWALGPLLAFIIVSAVFKVAGTAAHHKVDVYYKYKAGDLRLALWERLNHRLGACVGALNGTAYMVLLSVVIYVPSYVTYQFATPGQDPKWLGLLNVLGHDLQSSGMSKVAASIDKTPPMVYDLADLAGTLYRSPLSQARLANYPAFLSLSEQPQFVDLANGNFTEAWARQDPINKLMENSAIQSIRGNPELLKVIWSTVADNLQDFRKYLATGRSATYDPITILGRWQFDVSASVAALRRAKPNIVASEMQKVRKYVEAAYSKTRLTVKPDHQFTLHDVPPQRVASPAGATVGLQTFAGQWQDAGNKYDLSFAGMQFPATVEGDRIIIKAEGLDWVLTRED